MPLLLALFAVELPMSALAYTHVRLPWELALAANLSPATYAWARTFSAPLADELAKAWPLALLALACPGDKRPSPVAAGLAVGLGYGLGALGSHAWSPLVEGIVVCLLQGAFAAAFAAGAWNRRPALGLAAAMLAHWLAALPGAFVPRYLPPLAHRAWLAALLVAMVALRARMIRSAGPQSC